MEWAIKKNPDFSILTLQEIKNTLRINHSKEDDKLSALEKSAINYWENQTSYILNATEITLSVIPERDEMWNDYPKSANYISRNRKPLYSPPLALNIETQKPTEISITKEGGQVPLTQDELNELSNNFFNVVNQVPLQFYFYNKEWPEPFSLYSGIFGIYNQYHTKIVMKLQCAGLTVEEDIKQALLRMIAGLYENPDVSSEILEKDIFLNCTMDTYNCQVGIA